MEASPAGTVLSSSPPPRPTSPHPAFPPPCFSLPSLLVTLKLWRPGQGALHLPDLEMQGLEPGDPEGEMFQLEDPG